MSQIITARYTSRSSIAMSFAALGLSPSLLRAIADQGFSVPTPIQHDVIASIVSGRDLRAQAQTGSGKTAAFALALLARLQQLVEQAAALACAPVNPRTPRRISALVLVPTRELAAQVADTFRQLGAHQSPAPKVVAVFGGVSINPQMLALRGGANVVVATPGRLLDLINHNALQVGQIDSLVLDEADRLLDLGFAQELRNILGLLPPRRQTLMFSATFPAEVQALAEHLLHDPLRIEVDRSAVTTPAIVQRAFAVNAPQRAELLRHLIKDQKWTRVLVFVATQYAAEHVAWKLHKKGLFATPFHGGLSQGARTQVLEEFKNEQWDVVVTTDLAARGIDIPQLPVVVNFDLPRSAVDYTHRIGRTGRAGEAGLAVSFVSAESQAHWTLIQKVQGIRLTSEVVAGFEPGEEIQSVQSPGGTGGVKGKRPSKKDKLRAAAALAGATNGVSDAL